MSKSAAFQLFKIINTKGQRRRKWGLLGWVVLIWLFLPFECGLTEFSNHLSKWVV